MKDKFKKDYKEAMNVFLKYKNILILFLIILLFIYSEYFILIPVKLFNITEFKGPIMVLLDTFKNIILIGILYLIYRKEILKEWDIFRANKVDYIDTGIKYWFIGLLVMFVSNGLLYFFFNANAGNEEIVQSYVSSLPWIMLIDAGILGPISEEIVFRKAFKNAIKNKWLFVILSGLVFGGMHVIGNVNNWYDVLFIIPYGALGCSFAYAYHETDTIFTSLSIHMIHNLILLGTSILTLGFLI